jgi:hypothetical protein
VKEKTDVPRTIRKSESHRSSRLLARALETRFDRRPEEAPIEIDFKRLEDYFTERRRAICLADFLLST